MPIHYEPHPVSAERKAELREQGLTIVDARFAPADEKQDDASPKRGRPRKPDA